MERSTGHFESYSASSFTSLEYCRDLPLCLISKAESSEPQLLFLTLPVNLPVQLAYLAVPPTLPTEPSLHTVTSPVNSDATTSLTFLLFGSRPLPKTIQYLGKVLPPAIMTVLVIYCLRDTNIGQFPYGVPEFIACTLIVILQILRKNMYLSIIVGTAFYMFLIRVV